MADNEKELKLIINAYTHGVEAGMKKVQDDLAKLKSSTQSWGKDLTIASNALDVRPTKLINAEVAKLNSEYARLKSSGQLSQSELALAAANLKTKTAEARGQQTQLNSAMQAGQGITSNLTTSVTRLAAAYLSWRTVASLYSGITSAAKEAETAQFGLTASVEAAGREFSNTGGLDDWQAKVRQLSADLRIYSETDVANAASRTIDMTKRLGLSAEQMEELIRRTADLSAGKTDLEGGIERVTAALRGEAEASEYLGLTLNETYVKSWHEANNATGKAWKDLSDLEKAQIRYQLVLEQTNASQGRAAASVTTYSGALAYVKAQVDNAIASNDDMGAALQRVATLLADNATEIADFAASLTSALGHVIEFTLQNKELIGVLIGSGGLISLTASLTSNIGAIGGALKTLGGVKLPDILSPSGGINAALTARIGLYGTLAATIVATVAEYHAMRDAQAEAAAAEQRYQDSAARAQGIADAAAASTGLQIDNITELNRLLREGVVVRDEETTQFLTAEQAQKKYNDQAQRQIELNAQRTESFAEITDSVAAAEQKYGDLSAEALNAATKQQILDDALKNSTTTIDDAKQSTAQLADSYFDAATALQQLEEGEAGYQEALKAKLDAEKAYVQSVEQLKKQQADAFKQALSNEEKDLELSLDARLIQLNGELQDELISQREFNQQKAEVEQQYAEQVLAIRQRMYDEAAKMYGADSQQAIEARQAVVSAENALQDATQHTEQAYDQLTRASEECGAAGRRAGKAGREGMDEYRQGVELTREELRQLRKEQEAVAKEASAARSAAKKEALQQQTAGRVDGIANTISGMTSLQELQEWASQLTTFGGGATGPHQMSNLQIMMGKAPGNQYTDAINRYTRDLYLQKLNELSALEQQQTTTAASSGSAGTGPSSGSSKMMTVNLKAGSSSATVSLPQTDAGKLLDTLRQAGMVTA